MTRIQGAAVLALSLLTFRAPARVIHVDSASPGPVSDGSSWSSAFTTVAAGLAAAVNGDAVWVAEGVYVERVSPPGDVALYGGFNRTETEPAQRDLRASVTVLDGGGNPSEPVVNCRNSGLTLDGFVVRGGRHGVLVYMCSATLANNTVTQCAYSGVLVLGGSAVLRSNVVAGSRDGVTVDGSSVVLLNNTIAGNAFGVNVSGGVATMQNNIVAHNWSVGILSNVSAPLNSFSYNDVYGNTDNNFYGFTPPTGEGNLSIDPLFVKPSGLDYRLQPQSSCIDAGDDTAVGPGTTDRDGQTRILGQHVDIGAHEYAPRIHRVDHGAPGSVHDGLTWATAFLRVGDAVAACRRSDEIWVVKGVYSESLTLVGGVLVYGGFDGTEQQRSERDWVANPTVLDGAGSPDKPVVSCPNAETVLDGVTVRGGAVGIMVPRGAVSLANVVVTASASDGVVVIDKGNATLTGCHVTSNARDGLSVYEESTVSLTDCQVNDNGDDGVYLYGYATLVGCTVSRNADDGVTGMTLATFTNNVVVVNGGTGVAIAGSATMSGNLFAGNGMDGVRVELGDFEVVGNRIIGNGEYGAVLNGKVKFSGNVISGHPAYGVLSFGGSAELYSNAIQSNDCGVLVYGAATNLYNNTIYGNSQAGVLVAFAAAKLHNNILAYNGTALSIVSTSGSVKAFTFNDTFGNVTDFADYEPPAGQGNVASDPCFRDRLIGDFRLMPGSPCIDAGDDALVPADALDLDGRSRVVGPHVDIGACEAPSFFGWNDVGKALRIVAGEAASTPADMARLNVESSGAALDILDAIRLARKAAGLDSNP